MKTVQIISLTAGLALLAGCTTYRENMGYSREISFQELPKAAQQTVRNEVGHREITKINQDTKDGEVAYRVQVENDPGGLYWSEPVLWVSPSGEIIKQSKRLANKQRDVINEPAGAEINEPAGAEAPDFQDTNPLDRSIRTDPDFQ